MQTKHRPIEQNEKITCIESTEPIMDYFAAADTSVKLLVLWNTQSININNINLYKPEL